MSGFRRMKRRVFVFFWRGARRARASLYRHFFVNTDGYSAVLNWASLISLGLLFFALSSDSLGLLQPSHLLALFIGMTFLGLYVFVSFVEKVFAKHFIDFKSTQLFWLGVIAFLTFIAHGQAGDEVNAIFSQDASTFPYATTATAAMIMASWTLWPAVLVGTASLLYGLYSVSRSRWGMVLIALTVGLQLFTFSIFVEYQMGTEPVRKNNIYQIALAMDFNGHFRCERAMLGKDTVAFIGPSQDSALVAPPVVVKQHNGKSIFRQVEVPESFRRVSCM